MTKGRQVILASLRSPAQYQRLNWNLHAQDFVILDGGGTILQCGQRDLDWDNFVRQSSTLHSRDGRRAHDAIAHLVPRGKMRSTRISSTFARFRLSEAITADDELEIRHVAAIEGYDLAVSPHEVLIQVPEVSKASALRYIVDRHGITIRATAGDGALDREFMTLGPLRFAPQDSALAEHHFHGIEVVPRSDIAWRLSLAT